MAKKKSKQLSPAKVAHMAKLQVAREERQRKAAEERAVILATGKIICTKCKIEKPLDEFPMTRTNRKGQPRYAYCKPCHSETQRALRLRKWFDLSVEDFDKIMEYQGGVCFICKRPPKDGRRLAVDHCHKTGLVRGLLCAFCNRAIALFRDDLARFQNTVEYFQVVPVTVALGAPRYGLKGRVSNKAATVKRLNKGSELFERPKTKAAQS